MRKRNGSAYSASHAGMGIVLADRDGFPCRGLRCNRVFRSAQVLGEKAQMAALFAASKEREQHELAEHELAWEEVHGKSLGPWTSTSFTYKDKLGPLTVKRY